KPVVLAPQKEEALRVLMQIAEERKAPVIRVGEDYRYAPLVHTLEGQSVWIWKADEQPKMDLYIEGENTFGWQPVEIFVPMLGLHQVENAATAYAALCVAIEQGLHISKEAVYEGFRRVFWPGRFEVLRRDPPLIVDSAHNRDSALKLRIAIDDYLSEWPVLLVFGASEDKDVAGMFTELLPRVERLIVTESFHPRAIKAERLVELAHRFGRSAQKVLPIEGALEKALELAGSQTAIVVAGSLFVAAAARETWQRMGQPLRVFEAAEP
ncbi:MAG: cyanophycin synthetase, partial [Anaerolineales bacterium]